MKKLILTLSAILLLSVLSYAYSNETATVHAHYQHPVSGVIEDAGNNPGIGQGMVENVAHNMALFEEVDGKIYVCTRFNLANYISNVNFAVQADGSADFYAADYQVVQSTEDTSDFRFIVPSKEAIVRASCYIEPMQRDVVFYIDYSDFIPGNTDFIPLGEGNQMQNVIKSTLGDQSGKVEVQGVNDLLSAGQLGYNHGLLLNDSPQIMAMLNTKDKANQQSNSDQATEVTSSQNTDQPWGPMTTIAISGLFTLLVLVTFFFTVLPILLHFGLRYLKMKNDLEQEAIYEKD